MGDVALTRSHQVIQNASAKFQRDGKPACPQMACACSSNLSTHHRPFSGSRSLLSFGRVRGWLRESRALGSGAGLPRVDEWLAVSRQVALVRKALVAEGR